jgi:hypothetical protein
MMSAAISMTADTEQTKARPLLDGLSFHQGGPENISFAKSFDERVGISTLPQGKSSADAAAMALEGVTNATPPKKPDVVADIPGGVNGKDTTAQKISARGELTSAVAGKIIQVQAKGVVAEPQDNAIPSDSEMKTVDSPAPEEVAAGELSSSPSTPYGALAAVATDENPGPHLSIADGGHSSISNGGRTVIQKRMEIGEKVKVDASAKGSTATPKIVQKATATIVNAIAVDAKPIIERSAESAAPVVGQGVASTVALQGEGGKATVAFNTAASAVTKPSTGISPTFVDGQVRKESASGAKASVTDTEAAMATGSDPVAPPKTDLSPEKMPTIAIPGGSDGENKPQVREPGAPLLHSVGIVPTAFVSGNTSGELVTTKLPVGDAGTHTSLPIGSSEQDGAVAVAQSLDGAPRMLTATPTSLEVGVQNGTHGWLKVRAEMTDGGAVNASVSATSSAAQEMLHRELPALTAYLQEEKVTVNAIVVHAPSTGGADPRSSSGMGGAGGQTPPRSNEGGEQHQNLRKATLIGSDGPSTYRISLGPDEDRSLPLAGYSSGGGWLSVRA